MPFNKKRQIDADSDGETQVAKKTKGEKKGTEDLPKGTDGEGNPYWEVGNNRRIGVSQFKGNTLVNIREYYTAPDGELRPGKKGISLTLAQYKALLKVLPELNETLRSQGHAVDNSPATASTGDELGKAEGAAKPKKPKKANIDATSDEEEGEGE